jgi:hypothetical protein
MRRNNALILLVSLASACDRPTMGNREQRAGEVTVRDVSVVENASETPDAVGSPMAWRVVQGAAFYGSADQRPAFALRCDQARNSIIFERAGTGTALNISAGGLGSSLGTRAVNGAVQARTSLGDPLLDRMAQGRAQISVSGASGSLTLPGGVAIRRVVEFCRNPVAPEPVPTPEAGPVAENVAEPAPQPAPPPTL